MTPPNNHDPLIFFMRENGKLGLCLSYVGKWVFGILATLVATGTVAFFSLVYAAERNSREALVEIRSVSSELKDYKQTADRRFDRLETRIDNNDARDKASHGKGGGA
jgi:hypothetical protein